MKKVVKVEANNFEAICPICKALNSLNRRSFYRYQCKHLYRIDKNHFYFKKG